MSVSLSWPSALLDREHLEDWALVFPSFPSGALLLRVTHREDEVAEWCEWVNEAQSQSALLAAWGVSEPVLAFLDQHPICHLAFRSHHAGEEVGRKK